MLCKDWMFEDHRAALGERMGTTEELRIKTRQGHVVGYILTPCGKEEQRHPAVLMLHGFPGICNNHDIAQLLRSAGFVVFVPNAPGSWGSEGYYSFAGIVEAACDVAVYMASEEASAAYGIDPDAIFLFGHSMGGFAAVNAAKQLDLFRGCIFAAPCDLDWHFRNPGGDFIKHLTERAVGFLHTQTDLTADAARVHEEYAFRAAYPMLKNKNILLLQCAADQAIPAEMLHEFAQLLQGGYFGNGRQEYVILPTDHGFNDSKFAVAGTVVDFCGALLSE